MPLAHQQVITQLQSHYQLIRNEILPHVSSHSAKAAGASSKDGAFDSFDAEHDGLTQNGDWRQLTLWKGGRRTSGCELVPKTCALIEKIDGNHITSIQIPFGQIKFSLLASGTHVWPHCGPTNARLRIHLPLLVPDCVSIDCAQVAPRIRVKNSEHVWKEAQAVVIDDSFEHEVWFPSSSKPRLRLILIVDVIHPDLLEVIFDH